MLRTSSTVWLLTLVLALTLPGAVQAQFSYTTNNGVITLTSYNCSGWDVVIPNFVTSIGNYAFYSCTSLTNVTLPSSVTSIGEYAFYRCTGLTSITIPKSVTSIGEGAFSVCTELASVFIGNNVTNIGNYAFYGCSNLSAITVDTNNPAYSSAAGILFNKSQTTLIQCPGNKIGSVTIPNSVTSIGEYAFYTCTNLTSITIPNSVTTLGSNAFYICTSLTNVTIPSSVTSIGNGAFADCTSLTSVTIPDSLTSIGDGVFYSCTSLTSVTIPNSVTNIGYYAFAYCTSLTGAYFRGHAPGLGSTVFDYDDNATVYYLPGTTNWGSIFGGRPALLWNPTVETGAPSFGVRTNGFGFTITGTTGIPILIEGCTNLANGTWLPLQSLNLTNGSYYFSDAQWTNYPGCFYRIRSP